MIRVLVLDDANVIRSLVKLSLETASIEVDVCATIEEALQYAEENSYDLLIIDYLLAEQQTGFDFLTPIRAQGVNQNTPCIVLSGEESDEYKSTAKQLHVSAWLKKPFSPRNLLTLVEQLIDTSN